MEKVEKIDTIIIKHDVTPSKFLKLVCEDFKNVNLFRLDWTNKHQFSVLKAFTLELKEQMNEECRRHSHE